MKILFSPSESKKIPRNCIALNQEIDIQFCEYLRFIQQSPIQKVSKIMGYSKIEEVDKILSILEDKKSAEAIRLYDGIAYDALGFDELKSNGQEFLRGNMYICSNLFGFVRSDEILPFYKLKQGEGFEGFETKLIYLQQKESMDKVLEHELVLDLRAEFYKKLYKIPCHYYDFEFYKKGKKVSHYAKYYRGIVAKEVAKTQGIQEIEQRLLEYGLTPLPSKNQKNCTILAFCID